MYYKLMINMRVCTMHSDLNIFSTTCDTLDKYISCLYLHVLISSIFLKNVHSSIWFCVSLSPDVQCLQCILSFHWDDLFPFMFSSIWDLYLNQILASDRVRFARLFLSTFQFGITMFLTFSFWSSSYLISLSFSFQSAILSLSGNTSDVQFVAPCFTFVK